MKKCLFYESFQSRRLGLLTDCAATSPAGKLRNKDWDIREMPSQGIARQDSMNCGRAGPFPASMVRDQGWASLLWVVPEFARLTPHTGRGLSLTVVWRGRSDRAQH